MKYLQWFIFLFWILSCDSDKTNTSDLGEFFLESGKKKMEKGDIEAAIAYFRQGLDETDEWRFESISIRMELIQAYIHQARIDEEKRIEEKIEIVNKAIEVLNGAQAGFWNESVLLKNATSQGFTPDFERLYFASLIEKFATNMYFIRASLKNEIKDYSGALSDFNLSILHGPSSHSFTGRGICKENSGDYLGSIVDYTMALEFHASDSAKIYLHMGMLKLLVLEETAVGCSDLRKALELGSTDAYDEIEKFCK